MKLYLISQTQNDGYDTYDSAVVAASDEAHARSINPDGKWRDYAGAWCASADDVTAVYLGEAKEGTEAGVICASFNAG